MINKADNPSSHLTCINILMLTIHLYMSIKNGLSYFFFFKAESLRFKIQQSERVKEVFLPSLSYKKTEHKKS